MTLKMIVDILMFLLFLLALAYPLTDNTPHEWTGITLFILIIIHNVLNRRWYRNLFQGGYNARRTLGTAVNFLLLFCMLALAFSGAMLSRDALAFLHLPGSFEMRRLHSAAAYWGLILMAIHTGFHLQILLAAARNFFPAFLRGRIIRCFLRLSAWAAAAYGIYAFFTEHIGDKLFLRAFFSSADGKTLPQYMADYAAVAALYICLTHYALKFFSNQYKKSNG